MASGEAVSPPLLAFPERLTYGALLAAAPLLPPELLPAHLLPLVPAVAVKFAFGRLSRLQKAFTILAYALPAIRFLSFPFACLLLGLVYLAITWLDAKSTIYAFLPGEVRVYSLKLDELKLSDEISLRLEDVVSISEDTPFLSALFRLHFYNVCFKTRDGEVCLRGVPESLKLRARLRTRPATSRTERVSNQQLSPAAGKHVHPDLAALRREVEKGSAGRVEVSVESIRTSLRAEFINPRADALEIIEEIYLLAEKISRKLGTGRGPVLRVEGSEGRLRTNRIDRLL